MKKLLAILLTLVLCLGVFVSCDNSNEISSSEIETTEQVSTLPKESHNDCVTYYDEIKNFNLKSDAPNSALYKSYDELLNVLETPLETFDESIFDENYVLMIKGISYSGVSGYKGFANVTCEYYFQDTENNRITTGDRIVIEWHTQFVKDMQYHAIEQFTNALVIVPKDQIDEIRISENNVLVFVSRYEANDISEVTNLLP